jgi:hypothetical protein
MVIIQFFPFNAFLNIISNLPLKFHEQENKVFRALFIIAALYRALLEELNKLFQNEDGGIGAI